MKASDGLSIDDSLMSEYGIDVDAFRCLAQNSFTNRFLYGFGILKMHSNLHYICCIYKFETYYILKLKS